MLAFDWSLNLYWVWSFFAFFAVDQKPFGQYASFWISLITTATTKKKYFVLKDEWSGVAGEH